MGLCVTEGDCAFRGLQTHQDGLEPQRGVVAEQDLPVVVHLFELTPAHLLKPSGWLLFRVREADDEMLNHPIGGSFNNPYIRTRAPPGRRFRRKQG